MYRYIDKKDVSFSNRFYAKLDLIETLLKNEKWVECTLRQYSTLSEIYLKLKRGIKGDCIRVEMRNFLMSSAAKFAEKYFDRYFIEDN